MSIKNARPPVAKKRADAAKITACIAVYTALLIGVQFMLSFVAGVELVSLMICVFSVVFGVRMGLAATFAFVALRGLVFPYAYLNIFLDYVIYFPLFSLVCGFYGKVINRAFADGENALMESENGLKRALNAKITLSFIGLAAIVALLTPCFTLLDDLIAPPIMGFGKNARITYIYGSIPVLITHTANVVFTVVFLFFPAYKALKTAKRGMSI